MAAGEDSLRRPLHSVLGPCDLNEQPLQPA